MATVIFTLQDFGNYTAACALSIIIIVMIAILNGISDRLFKPEKENA